jgi:predicted MFS family arabinose efflux permease
VEGVNEMVIQAGGAVASTFAGVLLADGGWTGVILAACPLVAINTVALIALKIKRRKVYVNVA